MNERETYRAEHVATIVCDVMELRDQLLELQDSTKDRGRKYQKRYKELQQQYESRVPEKVRGAIGAERWFRR